MGSISQDCEIRLTMEGEALIEAVRAGVMRPKEGVFIAPIRHHSPSCAWAVKQMIRKVKPVKVLIEAPHDFEHLIPYLLDEDTKPPVAIANLLDQKSGPKLSAYFPFCGHSPEWVALKEGAAVGAELRFIDLGSDAKLEGGKTAPTGPKALSEEQVFDSGDYVRGLAQRLGCRDGYEVWDHLFETRLGENDWQCLLQDIGAYCAALRASTASEQLENSGDAAREAHMAACLRDAIGSGPVVVVVGGFHAAALIDPQKTSGKLKPNGKSAAQSYLIRYGYKELDALMGYAAGLPQPAYYEELWQQANTANGVPDWRSVGHDLVQCFVSDSRKKGFVISVPAQVELLRSAETLAHMRGRPGALRHDLIDGLKSSLLKGEASGGDVWSERFVTFLRGSAMGEVSENAGQPPIVADARARAQKLRFNLSDGLRRERKLDIRRKPKHLEASRYAHAMAMLGSEFAQRNSGPDFLNSVQTELLFEFWDYAWSPAVEGKLIEAAVLGDTVPAACIGKIAQVRSELADEGKADDLPSLMEIFKKGLLAGLGIELAEFLEEIDLAIRNSGDFEGCAQAMITLHGIESSRGPLSLPDGLDVLPVMHAAYDRLIYLCDDLVGVREDALPSCLDALRVVSQLLRGPGADHFDGSLFDEALCRVEMAGAAPEILGAIAAIAVEGGRRDSKALAELLAGQFKGTAPDLCERLGGLRGMLWIAPSLLWTAEGVLSAIDDFVASIDEEGFLQILPHLRLALSALAPREADRVAEILAMRHGGSISEFVAYHYDIDEETALVGANAETKLRASLISDGLLEWIVGDEGAA